MNQNIIQMKLVFVTAVMAWAITSAFSQNMTVKTNQIKLVTHTGVAITNTEVLPKIDWIYPSLEISSSNETRLQLQARVTLSSPVRQIIFTAGNNEDTTQVWVRKKVQLMDGQKQYDLQFNITFPEGANFAILEVITAEGVVVSEKRNLLIGSAALENIFAIDRKDYAILFGTDKYEHWSDLVNPIDDVHAIARELKEKYGFIVEMVENPTTEDVWTKLREDSERKFGPQDQLFVFFAGHGHYDETFAEGFVVAQNSLSNDLSFNSYISHNRLRGVINSIPCNHILLTMDVCFGGTLDPVVARRRGAVEEEQAAHEFLVRKFSFRTRKYLTSGGKEYVSDGIPGKHSPFAEKMIQALRERGGTDGMLTLAELQVFLQKISQLPRFGSFGDDEPASDFIWVSKK
jgi:hypothetical protein